jgi:hypothetical protein
MNASLHQPCRRRVSSRVRHDRGEQTSHITSSPPRPPEFRNRLPSEMDDVGVARQLVEFSPSPKMRQKSFMNWSWGLPFLCLLDVLPPPIQHAVFQIEPATLRRREPAQPQNSSPQLRRKHFRWRVSEGNGEDQPFIFLILPNNGRKGALDGMSMKFMDVIKARLMLARLRLEQSKAWQ